MNNRKRYTQDDVRDNDFYVLPKFLFEGEFESLSSDARILYSLLRSRHKLSVKNNWLNERGEVFFIFSRENMCDMLKLSRPTVTKAMNGLKKHMLIEEKRLGQGKANHIYLLKVNTVLIHEKPPQTLDNTEKEKSFPSRNKGEEISEDNNLHKERAFSSRGKEFFLLEGKNISPRYNEYSNNEKESKSKSCQSKAFETKTDMTLTMTVDDIPKKIENKRASANESVNQHRKAEAQKTTVGHYNSYKKIIQENIDYESFTHNLADIALVDGLIETMLDVICTECSATIKMGNEIKNRDIVRSIYLMLRHEHIDHVVDKYKSQRHKITHKAAYMRKMLYTVYMEIDAHCTNQVRVDGMVR